ncbi:hypothetical protein [Mesorhizobium sp. M4B.F.Ca.ET.214.01.1.1]|uniref:hypothetical protein n=1 Tax=Mesorhizobium sp. M4B.F.Ca.ET.214.01.1.1 TaxID=2563955 RepID=UPI001093486B|nr:hypothetical protein [Mesorhizobium sp. M4B.F.Ca.ET.214.01.1.1]TGQ33834.1 hypothetical protein EN857_22495 [Mesorhizobium sp. M4B.F.Ca.ET.214.01.1.1]
MDREDAQHAKMLEDRMQAIREDFIRAGMPKADIDWLVSNMWTQAHTPTIQTLEQYRLVAKTYTALDASIPKGDTRRRKPSGWPRSAEA